MRHQELCKELSRKLCHDLGATPFSLNKTSLTHPELKVHIDLKIQDEKGVVKTPPVWYGEAPGADGLMCCLLTALDDNPDNLEIACVFGFKDPDGNLQEHAVRAGFRYDWASESDGGTLIMRAGEQWLELSLMQRLQLSLGFESMVQDGVIWSRGVSVPAELQKNLSEIIEVDG